MDDGEHHDDIVRRVREVLEVIWKTGPRPSRRKPARFSASRNCGTISASRARAASGTTTYSRYSKSRRKAPIYWLLQSSKKNYALWLYYHRLDKDLLFKALVNYVEPKIRLEASRLEALRGQKAAAGESGQGSQAARQGSSNGRKTSSPNCGTSRTSCVGRRTCIWNPTSTMASC